MPFRPVPAAARLDPTREPDGRRRDPLRCAECGHVDDISRPLVCWRAAWICTACLGDVLEVDAAPNERE